MKESIRWSVKDLILTFELYVNSLCLKFHGHVDIGIHCIVFYVVHICHFSPTPARTDSLHSTHLNSRSFKDEKHINCSQLRWRQKTCKTVHDKPSDALGENLFSSALHSRRIHIKHVLRPSLIPYMQIFPYFVYPECFTYFSSRNFVWITCENKKESTTIASKYSSKSLDAFPWWELGSTGFTNFLQL